MDDYIAKVKKGNSFLVMRRSEQVFKISPFEFEEVDPIEDAKGWKTLVDFRKLTGNKHGIDARKLLVYYNSQLKRTSYESTENASSTNNKVCLFCKII